MNNYIDITIYKLILGINILFQHLNMTLFKYIQIILCEIYIIVDPNHLKSQQAFIELFMCCICVMKQLLPSLHSI